VLEGLFFKLRRHKSSGRPPGDRGLPGPAPSPRRASPFSAARDAALNEHANVIGLAVTLIALCVFFAYKSPHFFTVSNALVIGTAVSVVVIMAVVQTIVLISGGLDISITSVLALSSIATALALSHGAPLLVALLAGVAVGAAAGLVNSALIVLIGVNALIATIATQFAFRGVAFLSTDGNAVDLSQRRNFTRIGNDRFLDVPIPIWIAAGMCLLVIGTLRFTRFGSNVYSVGGSGEAARLAGIRVGRLRVLIYVLSGISAAVAGIVLTSLNQAAFPGAGSGDELTVIAAVILGGTALMGGRGSAIGTLLGVMMLGVLANGLNLLSVQAFWQIFIQGVVLILAVAFDALRNKSTGSIR